MWMSLIGEYLAGIHASAVSSIITLGVCIAIYSLKTMRWERLSPGGTRLSGGLPDQQALSIFGTDGSLTHCHSQMTSRKHCQIIRHLKPPPDPGESHKETFCHCFRQGKEVGSFLSGITLSWDWELLRRNQCTEKQRTASNLCLAYPCGTLVRQGCAISRPELWACDKRSIQYATGSHGSVVSYTSGKGM